MTTLIAWLFKGAGFNKTTLVAVGAIIGGIGTVVIGATDGDMDKIAAGSMLIAGALPQLGIRWSTDTKAPFLTRRTTWASIGAIFTGVYLCSLGNIGEGWATIVSGITALTQRSHNMKTA